MRFSVAQIATLASTLFGAAHATASVVTKCTEPNTVAITFDDGPYNWTMELVDLLDKYGAKGTFFVNGNNYGCIYSEENAKRLNYLIEKGHQLASHTWAHQHLPQLTGDSLNQEFTKTNEAIKKITGRTPAFMRPPYGEYNDEVVEKAANNGQTGMFLEALESPQQLNDITPVVIWDFDSGDSVGATVEQSKKNYDNILDQHPGSILTLNHETIETTAHQVIPYALKQIKAKGYKMVTVAECLGREPYQAATSPSARD
ncbi:Carbohydrate esterase 4 protein, partial [Ceratobasidium sp. 423]